VQSYYITERRQFAGSEAERRARLLQTIGKASAAGVDYIQLRERDLTIRELERLAAEALRVMRGEGTSRLLINHRTDVALAVGADGVHLTSEDIAASEARALAAKVRTERFLIAASCHSTQEVRLAESHGADFVVLAPVFEKRGMNGIGVQVLREAAQKDRTPDARVEAGDTRRRFAVFALGGVNMESAPLCAAAGATGVAGIRLFQQCEDLSGLVRAIREL
jgi:thiamine-phosphate pyrophosphorylase